MQKNIPIVITGLGAFLPEKRLTNSDLEKIVDTSDEWIVTRSGIAERRIAADDEFTSTMGAVAAQRALASAGITAEAIDAIIVCSMTPDYLCPNTAALIAASIHATRAAAIDIEAACTGFLYGLSMAKAWVATGMFQRVLVIASEKNSAFTDYTDRATCVLFGDGAGAAVVQKAPSGYAIGESILGADGSMADLLMIPASGCKNPASSETVNTRQHFINMNGKETFRHAVRHMELAATQCMEKNGLKCRPNWFIPHQANIRIMDAVALRLALPPESVVRTIHKYGNTSSATIPIALSEFHEANTANDNETILLVAVGGGLTWGATLLTKMGCT